MAEDKRETVKVACTHANGLMLFLFARQRDDVGAPVIARDGPGVRLNGPSGTMGGTNTGSNFPAEPGITEIDAEWWSKWVEQNAGRNAFFDHGIVREWKENPTS